MLLPQSNFHANPCGDKQGCPVRRHLLRSSFPPPPCLDWTAERWRGGQDRGSVGGEEARLTGRGVVVGDS